MSAERLTAEQQERARRNEATLLRGLQTAKGSNVAKALGVDEATVSRLKDGELQHIAKLLAAAGLKVVPTTAKCYDQAFINAIFQIAKQKIERAETLEELDFEH